MRAHRGKQLDWTKPFKLIESKTIFEELDTDANELVININTKVQTNSATINKKQEIIVPKIEIVRRITEPKKFAKVQSNYIRLSQDLNLPKLQSYELNEVDHVFLQGHANKFKFNGKVVLTPEFLSKAFIQLEKRAGKDPTLPRSKTWFTNFIQRQHKQLMALPNYEQFTQVFYNYWKNRREELKFPMLRELWHPNPDQYNHLLAFKPREKEKRNLRRNNRLPEDEIAQQMEQQFLLATKIAERIKFREELKLKQIQLQLTNFHNECKQFFGSANFFGQFDSQSRQRDKDKLKKLQNDVENVKKLQIEEQQENKLQSITATTYDQKQSVAEFLSTVINVAQNFGLNYERVFNDKVVQKQPVVAPLPLPQEPETTDEKHDYMAMKICKDNDTIYRYFTKIQDDENEQTQNYIKPPKDLFEYKSKELQYYYYGSDDEGDAKDLKKNIAASFKKFQLNKISSVDL